jgi:hypothetical protein
MKNFTKSKFILLVAIIFISCSSEESTNDDSSSTMKEVFALTTFPASDILPTTTVISSLIKSDTEMSIKTRGVCYNTTGNPTISDQKVEDPESIIGPYSTLLIGLDQNKTHFAKVFAIGKSGNVFYGNEIQWKTSTVIIIPTSFLTYDATNVTSNSAILGGVILKNGNLRWDNLKMGICFSAFNKLPNINESVAYANTEVTEPFRVSAKNLKSKTTYYFRPFASNFDGTEIYYGDTQSFTTNSN